MPDEILYLTVSEIIEMHAQTMHSMGSNAAPLRSEDLLESAVMKPQAVAWYGGADLAEQACVLAIGISQNQPFLDGIKRTAYVAFKVFLEINNVSLSATPMEIAQQLIDVAERMGSLEEAIARFVAWVRDRTVAANPG